MSKGFANLNSEQRTENAKYARSCVNPQNLRSLDQSWTLDSLNNITKQTLFGSMLGDGCVKKNGSNELVYNISHSLQQQAYFEWKLNLLSIFEPKIGNSIARNKIEASTPSHPIFTKLRKDFYGSLINSRKNFIPYYVAETIDIFGLMIWYLDDGYIGRAKDGTALNYRKKDGSRYYYPPRPKIAAKKWNTPSLVYLLENVNSKFNLHLKLSYTKYKVNDINQMVTIPACERTYLLEQWRTLALKYHVPSCMYYKLNLHNEELLTKERQDNKRYL